MDANIQQNISSSRVQNENFSDLNGENYAVSETNKRDSSKNLDRDHSWNAPTFPLHNSSEGSSIRAQWSLGISENGNLFGRKTDRRENGELWRREVPLDLLRKLSSFPNWAEDLSSSDSELDLSDSEGSWGSGHESESPKTEGTGSWGGGIDSLKTSPEMTRERIEQMDRLYAHALQFREMHAQNLDLINDGDIDTGFYEDILRFDAIDLSDVEDNVDADFQETPPYPVGRKSLVECAICAEMQSLWLRPCCDLPVCSECLSQYLTIQVNQGNVRLECPSGSCNSYIHRDEVLAVLDTNTKEKYYRFLVNANQEPHIKSCPRCNYILILSKDEVKTFRFLPKGYKVECSSCGLVWCFPCQAPWHENVRCRDFRKGDKLLKDWSKKYRGGQQNAQRCPKCKVYIQRATGCDHMICSRCRTNFCYRCGERFRHIKFIGDHYSRLSVFGCRYRFMPERPVKRKLIRGAILGGKLLAAPVVAGLAVGGAALVIGFGTIAAPFYGGYKLHKHLKQRKRIRQRQAFNQTGHVGQFQLNGSPFSQYYENLEALLRREEELRRRTDNRTIIRARADSLEAIRLRIPTLPDHFFWIEAPAHNTHTAEQTQITAHAQSDEDKLTVTTTELTRQQSTSNNNNVTETEYPMEVLNVVTNYEISPISAAVEGNSNNSTRASRTHKTRKTSRTQALKSSEKNGTEVEMASPKAFSTETQSAKESFTPAKAKSKDKQENKGIFSIELEKNYPEEDALLKDPNNSLKNGSKDFEYKNSSHMPWINIVCGKINRDKDLKEDAERKISAGEGVSKKGNKKTLPPLPSLKLCHERSASPSSDRDYNPKVTQWHSLHHLPKQDNLGAFGPVSDDDDDQSMSSTNQSPVCESKRSYYEPTDSNLDYIDDDLVSEYSEMTSL